MKSEVEWNEKTNIFKFEASFKNVCIIFFVHANNNKERKKKRNDKLIWDEQYCLKSFISPSDFFFHNGLGLWFTVCSNIWFHKM